ncbi:hypothetical protein GGD81_003169 [Rhodobium orientis]|uniref:Aminoglycoside phosphotransferase domain-containing protein n=1 Tax=Rhodobium orientis TaxID=34017 RepID=A0A327JEY0_9HYPH|nr:bifunctional aminoglycoside phosphotransferase/ATP-binding protein [Rhodobium orientis]MBB4304113.1 hypothetical protein [Rhodobium orientis]MBK5948622.1 hypothetical protein [Rhodobium orientis]RAI24294.1 hypothetical protein CH339_22470 [Rhodobium orientis]
MSNNTRHGHHVVEDQGEIVAFLQDPKTYGISQAVRRIDTHAAMVFLAGDQVLKIKRAVRYPYLDFSTLEKRHRACLREIEVNRDNAPEIYRDVVAITRKPDGGLAIGGDGKAVAWAVRMNRFDETETLDRIAEHGPLSDRLVDNLVARIAASHERAPQREAAPWLKSLAGYIANNETGFKEWPDLFDIGQVHALSHSMEDALQRLTPLIEQRGRLGHIRLCHGDCHLGNIACFEGTPVLFDAIEFDDAIATNDVLYDLAFLLMDLWERGDRRAANRMLCRYLAHRPDPDHFEALAALPFFMALRAGIRAMVTASRLAHLEGDVFAGASARAADYFALARTLMDPAPPRLYAVGGLSGTGKSTIAAALAPDLDRAPGALVLRSDIERKDLFGIAETDHLPEDAYTLEVTHEVYHRIIAKARTALAAGQSVVLDAVFSMPAERAAAERIADAVEVPFTGLWLEAPAETLFARVEARTGDASDADVSVVKRQLTYDLGTITWARVDASGGTENAVALARQALRQATPAAV